MLYIVTMVNTPSHFMALFTTLGQCLMTESVIVHLPLTISHTILKSFDQWSNKTKLKVCQVTVTSCKLWLNVPQLFCNLSCTHGSNSVLETGSFCYPPMRLEESTRRRMMSGCLVTSQQSDTQQWHNNGHCFWALSNGRHAPPGGSETNSWRRIKMVMHK